MNKEQLLDRLSELEWEDFEVKEAKNVLPKSSWETVSAFSNTNGGYLVFGIKERGKGFEITGVHDPEKIEQNFLNTINNDKFNVRILVKSFIYNIENKIVLSFYIPASSKKPVYFNSLTNTFIRRGSSDQRATKEEVDYMYRDQTFGTKTSEKALNTTANDLNQASLRRYRDYMSRFNPNVSYNRFDNDTFLQKMRIVEDGCCTYSGLLMLGTRDVIEKYFPDFKIDLLEIPGTSYGDSKSRYSFRLDEFENLWEYYFECFARLKQKVDITFSLNSEGFGQELSPGLDSMREALVNMLMHADYFSPSHSRIRVFTSHIEFYNPGGLPKSIDELKEKDISIPRNPIITKLFRMVKLAENAGFGFDKIENNWKLYNNTSPEYDIAFDSTILKLYFVESKNNDINNYRNNDKKDLNSKTVEENVTENVTEKRDADILDFIKNNTNITTSKLAELFGVTRRTIARDIEFLKKNNRLKRIGGDKGGHWEVLK